MAPRPAKLVCHVIEGMNTFKTRLHPSSSAVEAQRTELQMPTWHSSHCGLSQWTGGLALSKAVFRDVLSVASHIKAY